LSTTLTVPVPQFFFGVHTLLRLWDPSEHPFYRRWSAGRLRPIELATFAAQYHYAVEAIAALSERAVAHAPPSVRRELEQHARVEAHHLKLWQAFRSELPRPPRSTPTAEARRCAATWNRAGRQPFERHLAVLYAIGMSRARVSAGELSGLARTVALPAYATEYLALHAGLDAQRARCARRMLEPLLSPANCTQLVDEIGAALQVHWELLTGIEGIVG
jgi:pyrroloquinoline quinone (PQQ) biosynthesis protein C